MKDGMNNSYLKRKNRGLVLKLIATGKNYSRADITYHAHLTKMTISNIVNELIQNNFVIELKKVENNSVGRNPIILSISPSAPKIIGLYLSRDNLVGVLADIKCDIIYSIKYPLKDEDACSLSDKLLKMVYLLLQHTKDIILGIGVSTIGPLDAISGILLNPTNFFHICDFPIKELLEHEFNIPTIVNNDMNACALAESLYGSATNWTDFLYVGITNGIGAGIISNGNLYQNRSSYIGELGHVGININGPVCSCGRKGCLESYINMPKILSIIRTIYKNPSLTYLDFHSLEINEHSHILFTHCIEKLAYALTNTVNMINPEGIIIGHEGAYLPNNYITLLENLINSNILTAKYHHIPVKASVLKDSSPIMGSICLILDPFFSGSSLFTI